MSPIPTGTPGSLPITLLLFTLLLATPTHALGVGRKAAIGIGSGLGALVLFSIIGALVVKYYKRKERRAALERGEEVELRVPKPSNADVMDAHGRGMAGNFDIWGK
ncbi:hypothetical protein LTR36_006827 [Oleoguttula mirabilis]|uniref:Uncharacterized protein n=1 Tax=Oleoguttula mirabilis TaxID=1507867 RepID=A0AAV9JB81_9PEZI|nr:hypothetical protein LTR36_006827 [Oleoguttula mirabilis]